jgi:hypothetical protein
MLLGLEVVVIVVIVVIALVVVYMFHFFIVIIRGNSLAYQMNLLNLIRHLILVIPILVRVLVL